MVRSRSVVLVAVVATLLSGSALVSGSALLSGSALVSGSAQTLRNRRAQITSPVPTTTTQLVIGIADSWSSSSALITRYSRTPNGWIRVDDPSSARLGPNGLAWGRGRNDVPTGSTIKTEGDGRSPAGVFSLPTAFGYDAAWRERTRLPFVAVGPNDLFVEDPDSSLYNQHVRLDHAPTTAWERKQQMRQHDPAHRLEILVGHNTAPNVVAGAGSAIFIHVWRNGGDATTAGCTSMSDGDVDALVGWLDPAARPLYVLLPRDEYVARQKAWKLPVLE